MSNNQDQQAAALQIEERLLAELKAAIASGKPFGLFHTNANGSVHTMGIVSERFLLHVTVLCLTELSHITAKQGRGFQHSLYSAMLELLPPVTSITRSATPLGETKH